MSKKYEVIIGKRALKTLKKMDKGEAAIIMAWIKENLIHCEDPYRFGKALKHNLKGLWRYRIGDYRLIADVNNEEVLILLLEIGHRRQIYDN